MWVYVLYSHIPPNNFLRWFMHHVYKRMSKISFQACIVPFMSVDKESLIYKSSYIFLNVHFRAFSLHNYFIVPCYFNLFKKNAAISQIIMNLSSNRNWVIGFIEFCGIDYFVVYYLTYFQYLGVHFVGLRIENKLM